MWECPDFFPLDGKQVLMLGPMEMLPKGEFHNGHNVIAFIGSYDEATHTFTRENVQLMDGGHRLLRHPDHSCPGWPPAHDRMAADLVGHRG